MTRKTPESGGAVAPAAVVAPAPAALALPAAPTPDGAPAQSIEDFAASIMASLGSPAPAATPDSEPLPSRFRRSELPFRERARRRIGHAELLVFRVARELFAVELVAVEEAIDLPTLHRLPEMPPTMLGVFTQRGALVSVHAPDEVLGVSYQDATTVVVFCGTERRVAIAADDVDDALTVRLTALHDAPGMDASDGVLVGVVHRGRDLIGVLDADALISACRNAAVMTDVVRGEAT
jgi:purine-binding chemotaxis protein CheW